MHSRAYISTPSARGAPVSATWRPSQPRPARSSPSRAYGLPAHSSGLWRYRRFISGPLSSPPGPKFGPSTPGLRVPSYRRLGAFAITRTYSSSSELELDEAPVVQQPARPTHPGEVFLNFANFEPELHTDTPVEYLESGIRKLGLLQKPRGRRNWLVLDELGHQIEVNQYSLSFQWPSNRMDNGELWTIEELHKMRLESEKTIIRVMEELDPDKVWEYLNKSYDRVIPLDSLARLLLNLKKGEPVSGVTLYIASRYLAAQDTMYARDSRRGFVTLNPEAVTTLKELKENMRAQTRARDFFLRKLRKRLEFVKTQGSAGKVNITAGRNVDMLTSQPAFSSIELPKDSDDATFKAEIDLVTKKPPKDDSDAQQISELTNEPVTDRWMVEKDINFMHQIKMYALGEDEEAVDAAMYTNFLYPLGYGDKPHDAFQLLVDLGVWDRFQNPHILRWNASPLGFEPKEEQFASALLKAPPADLDATRRVDLGELPAFAMDPANPYEIDDAVSIAKEDGVEWVWIHIADPTRFVPAHSLADQGARIRGGSIFLPDRAFPMFHPTLLEAMSLKEGEKRPALSFGAIIDQIGRVVKYKIVPTYVKNVISLTYLEADQILVGEDNTRDTRGNLLHMSAKAKRVKQQYLDMLEQLTEVATRRRRYRLEKGAVIASIPHPEVRLLRDPDGNAHVAMGVSGDFNKNSRGVVTELMLLVGELAGTFLSANQIPAYYHMQALIPGQKAKSMDDIMSDKSVMELKNRKPRSNWVVHQYDQMKLLGTSYIDAVPGQHHRYGLSRFTTVTSPLRRYFDFATHHQIKSILRRQAPAYTLMQLHEYLPAAHNLLNEIRHLQSRSARFWILNYLFGQYLIDPNRRYKASVIKPNSDLSREQATLMLTQLGLESDMTKTRYVNRGDPIWVRVDLVSPFYDKLILKEIPHDGLMK